MIFALTCSTESTKVLLDLMSSSTACTTFLSCSISSFLIIISFKILGFFLAWQTVWLTHCWLTRNSLATSLWASSRHITIWHIMIFSLKDKFLLYLLLLLLSTGVWIFISHSSFGNGFRRFFSNLSSHYIICFLVLVSSALIYFSLSSLASRAS